MAMQMELLKAYGINPAAVSLWQDYHSKELLPVQEKAITQFPLFHGGNLIVFAPTSAGKTFIGEILTLKYTQEKKRIFYLVPMKALAEEKYAQFEKMYRPLKVKTVISTRDRRQFDPQIESGKFDVAIVVYEKLSALMVRRPHLIEEVGLVVVDELQMIGQEERGPCLEMLLTRILLANKRPQLLGLSAVLGRCQDLARWLEADLLIEEKRPVELRKGVFYDGVFHYQEHNSGQEGEEQWIKVADEDYDCYESMFHIARYLAQDKGEQTLVFLRDKPSVESFARRLSQLVNFPPAKDAIEELQGFEESVIRDLLLQLLQKGIGIHHADLTFEERELMEHYLKRGDIRLLCATSTLSQGVNLSAKNVLIDRRRWHYSKRYKKPHILDITKAEHENMGGRVARYGFPHEFGRSIIFTNSGFHLTTYMNYYVKGGFEELVPPLSRETIDKPVLNLIASGRCSTPEEVYNFLQVTFTGSTVWSREMIPEEFQKRVIEILDKCQRIGLVERDQEGYLFATERGKIAAQKGLSLNTCWDMLEWLKSSNPHQVSELEILLMLALTEDGENSYLTLSTQEHRGRLYRTLLRKEAHEAGEEGKEIFRSILEKPFRLAYDEDKAIKKALVLKEWISTKGTCEIERRYLVYSGAIRRIGEEFSWLVESLAALAEVEGWIEKDVEKLQRLSHRLIHGLTEKGLALSQIRIRGLGRTYINRLIHNGYDTLGALAELPLNELRRSLPKSLAQRLYKSFHPDQSPTLSPLSTPYTDEEGSRQTLGDPLSLGKVAEGPIASLATDPILRIDRGRLEVFFKGLKISLPPLAFKLLTCLADRPGVFIPRGELYQKLYGGEGDNNGSHRPYEHQISDHKRKIIAKIKKVIPSNRNLGEKEIKQLILTRPRVGYMLNLKAEEVEIIDRT